MSPVKPAVAAVHRAAIVDAAKQLFANKGFDGTTMDDVARASGYSKRTVYVYVAGKADIQNSIVLAGFTDLLDQLRHLADRSASLTVREALETVSRHLVALHENDPYLFASMMSFQATDDPGSAADPVLTELGRVDDELDAAIVRLVTDAEERGELRAGLDPARTAFVLWAELSGLVTMALSKDALLRRRLGLGAAELIAEGVAVLAHSVTAPIGAPATAAASGE